MKTLADFKRLAVVGAQFNRGFSQKPMGSAIKDWEMPLLRTVCHRQSNAIAFAINDTPEMRADAAAWSSPNNRAWVWFPEAADLKFVDGVMCFPSGMTLQFYQRKAAA